MAVSDDIAATYRGPGRVVRRLLALGPEEGRALAYLLAALVLFFIAQWPGLARASYLEPDQPLIQRMMAAFLAVLATLPVFYLLAALSHLVLRAFGGQGGWYGARLALFWALLAVAPLVLLQGLVSALIGPGAALTATGVMVFAIFLWFWGAGLKAAEFGTGQ